MNTLKIPSFKFSNSNLIFKDVYFEFNSSDNIGIIGENGCGKSTFLRILSEQIKLKGLTKNFDYGLYSSEISLIKDISLLDNFKMYAQFLDKTKFFELVDLFSFENMQSKTLRYLSKGNFTKAHLIFLLSLNYNFFLFDEPTENLDHESKQIFTQYLTNHSIGYIIVSHDLEVIKKCCKKIYKIENQNFNLLKFV